MTAAAHVALFIPDLSGGGAERVMLNLANGFAERGLNVDLVLQKQSGVYLDQVDERVEIHDLEAGRALGAIGPLVHYLRHRQPDALISALGQMNLVAVLARWISTTRVPVLVTEHETFERGRDSGFVQRLFPRLARLLYPAATIAAVSEGAADSLAEVTGLPRERINVLYNPVLTDDITGRFADPLPESAPTPYVLAAGRLVGLKNFPLLLRAFAKIAAEKPDLNLVILGEGDDRAELETLRAELGLQERVSLPGFTDNPYPWLKHAAAFVLSSNWEGLPTVLIEALAAGVPVVATDCPSGPSEILEGGRLGRLVPVNDVDALATALLEAVQENGNPAQPADLERYTLAAAADAYLELLGLGT